LHRAKDGGGFTNSLGPDGTSHWVTPLGRLYSRPPNEIWHPEDHDSHYPEDDPDDGFPADTGPAAPVDSPHRSNDTNGLTNPEASTNTAESTPSSANADVREVNDEQPPF